MKRLMLRLRKYLMNRYHSYKNSGVKLIGEIPSSWKISKLKYLSQLYTGNSLNENQKIKYESNILKIYPIYPQRI